MQINKELRDKNKLLLPILLGISEYVSNISNNINKKPKIDTHL